MPAVVKSSLGVGGWWANHLWLRTTGLEVLIFKNGKIVSGIPAKKQ